MIKIVASNEIPERLDSYIAKHNAKINRSFAKKLSDENKILINNKISKASDKVKLNDIIKIDFNFIKVDFSKLKIPIIYEDNDCIVIDKPAGLLTHSKGNYNPEPTVAGWLQYKLSKISSDRDGIVHRLDRGTSGVMICAKTIEACKFLQKQFATRKVLKTYYALIVGELEPPEAIIDMPIERNPKLPSTFRVGIKGKSAVTHYKTLKVGKKYSLIELKPTTGRTHQLRVHLKKLNHPIVGDNIYNGEESDRIYLHAYSLEILLPNHKKELFTSRLPKSFDSKLRNG